MRQRIRIFSFLLAAVLLLCGCKNYGNKTPPVTEGFICNATITYGDIVMDVSLTRLLVGTLTAKVNSPSSLAGMEICIDNEGVNVSYMGLKCNFDNYNIPQIAFAGAIVDALDFASNSKNLTLTRKDGQYLFCGKSNAGDFTITTFEDSSISMLCISSLKLEVDFINNI